MVKAHFRAALSITMGWTGFDRIYNGQVLIGVLKLVTLGGFFVWWFIDAIYYTVKAGESAK